MKCIWMLLLWVPSLSLFAYTPFGEILCHQPGYTCKTIQRGESWGVLFPNKEQCELVKRVNRTNLFLKPDMVIAVPTELPKRTLIDLAPFPRQMRSIHEKTIYIDQKALAWGAYDKTGQLLRWGPISPGSYRCLDVQGDCLTPTGSFRIQSRQGINCVSSTYPQQLNGNQGGGAMPYCLHFFKGFALHGSHELPGYPASHGCIRLLMDDARWLNERFVKAKGSRSPGTRVIILNEIVIPHRPSSGI